MNLVEALVGVEVMLPREDGKAKKICKVLRVSVDKEGNYIGTTSEESKFNSVVMQVQCWDWKIRKYAANVITENVLGRCNQNGLYACDLKEILGHREDSTAVKMEDLSPG